MERGLIPGSTVGALSLLQIVCALLFTVLALRRIRAEPGRGWLGLAVLGAAWLASRILVLVDGSEALAAAEEGTAGVVWLVGIPFGLVGIYRQCFGGIPGSSTSRAPVAPSGGVVLVALLAVTPGLTVGYARTVGPEALVRWPHPDRGLLLPGGFLPLAERSGLMGVLGREVLTQAWSAAATWPDRGDELVVAVNLAPQELLDP